MKNLKNFYLFIIGQFVSQFGSKMTSYGVTLWIYKNTQSVFYTSLVTLCYLVPEILLNFIAGTLSDKWEKKTILKITDTISGLLSFIILFLLLLEKLKFQYLFIINIIFGIADAFQNPTSEVVISLIVSKEDYIKTNGIRSFFKAFLDIFVPIFSVFIYSFWGLKYIIFVDLLTFIFCYVTLVFYVNIPKINHTQSETTFFKKFIFGINYIILNKEILYIILFMGFINLIYGIYSTALSPMILLKTQNNDFQLGIVSSMIGIAGIIGSMLLKFFPQTKNYCTLITNIMIFSFGICNFSLGFGKNYIIWSLGVFLGNILVPLLLANVDYIMRVKIPLDLQGRVYAARNTIQFIFLPIGIFLSGFINDFIILPVLNSNYYLLNKFYFLGNNIREISISLLYVTIGFIGVIGCLFFRKNKNFKKLNNFNI